MIDAKDFVEELQKHHLNSFIEVPCSILEPVIDCLLDKHVSLKTPANEGIAMGLAAGHHMASGNIPVVMMQNSGLCNALNALTSLHGIYNIPVLLIITWRGEPGIGDAPEHRVMGVKLEGLLEELELPYRILTEEGYRKEIGEMVTKARRTRKPVALILRKGLIREFKKVREKLDYPLARHNAIRIIKEVLGDRAVYISANGLISRVSFNQRDASDFYMIGSMGHAMPIGLGVASETDSKIVVLDGDGGCLMHMGAMASVGAERPRNLIHIVLDNEVHGSTGDQPSLSPNIDFLKIAKATGYENIFATKTEDSLHNALETAAEINGPTFIHVKINRKNPPKDKIKRVSESYTCPKIKERFMKRLKKDSARQNSSSEKGR